MSRSAKEQEIIYELNNNIEICALTETTKKEKGKIGISNYLSKPPIRKTQITST